MEEDDSDWEYEYHETETESFYVTLDLSSAKKSHHLANQKDPGESKSTNQAISNPKSVTQAGSTLEDGEDLDATANTAYPNDEQEAAEEEDDDDDAAPNANPAQDDENNDGNDTIFPIYVSISKISVHQEDDATSEPSDRIQILDLHSHNPIISYQNQMYSCEWTSTIGTDVLLTDPDSNVAPPILKQEPGVTVLGMTNIKLFARPVQISTREGKAPRAAPATSIASAAEAATDDPSAPASAKPVTIPVSIGSREPRHKQARFLERLIAIKAAKGEKDEVTVYASKETDGSAKRFPEEEVQTKDPTAVADDAETGDASGSAIPTVQERTSTRSRGGIRRPRGSTPRSARSRAKRGRGGGLFRDFKTTSSSAATPSSRSDHSNANNSNNRLSPSAINTPPPVPHPTTTHPPPTSHPNTDPPNTDYTKIDTAPNAPPDPDVPHTPPAADLPPTSYSTAVPPLRTATGSVSSEPKVSGSGRGVGAPSLVGGVIGVGNEDRLGAAGLAVGDVGLASGVGGDDGGGASGGAGRVYPEDAERDSESDVEMADG